MKSDAEITDILYSILNNSDLYNEVKSRGGDLYADERPTNSRKEDITISVLDGLVGKDSQENVVNINIYVPDVPRDNQMIIDKPRVRNLSRLAINLLEEFTVSEYRFFIEKQKVYKVNGADEHCINNRLSFTHLK